jgi:hypothetical protein
MPGPSTPPTALHPQTYALNAVSWAPRRDLELAEWSAIGRHLGRMVRASQWWLGDWIRYGNAKFGERYTRAVNLTGYDVQSLMIMVHVAARFEIFRRRNDVSWSHHAALASLEPGEQDRWLEECHKHKLSVADLRVALRGHGAGPRRTATARTSPPTVALRCPHCGGEIRLVDGVTPAAVAGGPSSSQERAA